RPAPVLPEVGSTIVPPGFSSPSRSAASIIASPIRSLTEPPGFRYSSLASRRAPPLGESRSSRTIGVSPTRSSSVGYSRAIARRSLVPEVAAAGDDHRRARRLDGVRDLVVADRAAGLDDRAHALLERARRPV